MKNTFRRLIAIALCISLCFAYVVLAADNASKNNYGSAYHDNWLYASVVHSYLMENADGTLTSIDYDPNYGILVQNHRSDYTLSDNHTLPMELPLFGGFFSGATYNFVVYGQENPEENDALEVLRVVKYDKQWHRLGHYSAYGINTVIPFDAGSLRMTESDGKLYIHTCHEMYALSDGKNHQANMTFVIDQSTMTEIESLWNASNFYVSGYVSHSFNQFIRTDGQYVFRADHGDGGPRAIAISRCNVDGSITDVTTKTISKMLGINGDNATGVSLGGLELSENHCLIAYNSVDQTNPDNFKPYGGQFNVYVSILDKDLKTVVQTVQATNYAEGTNLIVGTPQLVKISDTAFVVLWEEFEQNGPVIVKGFVLDENGSILKETMLLPATLSDCQPIVTSDGQLIWYVTDNETTMLYKLNPTDFVLRIIDPTTGAEQRPTVMPAPTMAPLPTPTPTPTLPVYSYGYAASGNIHHASVIHSYLQENHNGTITRVDYTRGGLLIVEDFTSDYVVSNKTSIPVELPLFGGFFSGETYNFLVFGQENPTNSESCEVLRVVKYDKDWNRLGQYHLTGSNTAIPFFQGSLRMTEQDGRLYIHTCYEMCTSKDAQYKQANRIFVLDQETMQLLDSTKDSGEYAVANFNRSLNQFIRTDGQYVFRVNHRPRTYAIELSCSTVNGLLEDDETERFLRTLNSSEALETGISVGGFELSADNCLIAYSSVDQSDPNDFHPETGQRNIHVQVVGKGFGSSSSFSYMVMNVTDYSEHAHLAVGTPYLVKLSDTRFAVMWEETDQTGNTMVNSAVVNEKGFIVNYTFTSWPARLSDCQPIVTNNGQILWYVDEAGKTILYQVDPATWTLKAIDTSTGTTLPTAAPTPAPTATPTPTSSTEPAYKQGDVDKNGVVNAADALVVLNHAAFVQPIEDPEAYALAMMNEDTVINAADALVILEIAAGIRK